MKRFLVNSLWMIFAFQSGRMFAQPLPERIYVQTDKQMYLAGEPVWMKFFTTDSERLPMAYSKIAYAELVSDVTAVLQIKVELSGGVGAGRMLLPADLASGYYRLIAYTQYMRNEGVDVFFEKTIAVLNTFLSGYQPETQDLKPSIVSEQPETQDPKTETVSVRPDRETYATRMRGELTISGLPENIHTLSVSVAGKECIPLIESDASLYHKNLIKKSIAYSEDFLTEYEGHIVTGKLIHNQTGQPATNAAVSLPAGLSFPTGDGIRFFSGQRTGTDEVRFCTSGISGAHEIATVIFRTDDQYRVDVQSPFVARHTPKAMPALQIHASHYDQLLDRSVALQLFRYFSDDPSETHSASPPHFKMKPTHTYRLDEYTRFTSMREIFVEFISGARFRRNAGKQELSVFTKRGDVYEYGTLPLVLLDGVPLTDHEVIYNYDPLTVEKINIYYGPCILGSHQFDGIVELVTYRRLHADLNLNRSTQIISYEGPQRPYHFNVPDHLKVQNRMPDGRHTLLWNPDVKAGGKASIRLPFDTSELTGEFHATVEGITKDGAFIFATAWFHVE